MKKNSKRSKNSHKFKSIANKMINFLIHMINLFLQKKDFDATTVIFYLINKDLGSMLKKRRSLDYNNQKNLLIIKKQAESLIKQ